MLMSTTCSAMVLSEPIELGSVASVLPNGEFKFTGAQSVEGNSSKGIVKFDDLYVHYNNSYVNSEDFKINAFHSTELSDSCHIGASTLNNTLTLPIGFPHKFDIYLINTDENMKFYLLAYDVNAVPSYKLLGKHKNKFWSKYFETTAAEKYYGMDRAFCYNYYVKDDTIVFEYGKYNSVEKKFINYEELIFHWEDDTQWFGVEHISHMN